MYNKIKNLIKKGDNMEVPEIVNLFVNNGVAVAMVIYFAVRDWKLNSRIQETLVTLVDTVETLKDFVKGGKEDEKRE